MPVQRDDFRIRIRGMTDIEHPTEARLLGTEAGCRGGTPKLKEPPTCFTTSSDFDVTPMYVLA